MKSLVPKNMIRRLAQINGEAGFITYFGERPFAAITLHVNDNRVQKIFIVTNPEKLTSLFPLCNTDFRNLFTKSATVRSSVWKG